VLLAAAVALAAAAPARALVYHPTETVDETVTEASSHFDAQGNVLVEWLGNPAVGEWWNRPWRFAWATPDGRLGPAGFVTSDLVVSRAMAVAPDGEAVAVWGRADGTILGAASPGPGRPFGPSQVLSPKPLGRMNYAWDLSIAADGEGNTLVGYVWDDRPAWFASNYRPHRGAFGPPLNHGENGGEASHVAMNAAGLAVAAWTGPYPSRGMAVGVKPPGSPFGPAESAGIGAATYPRVAVGPDGTAMLVADARTRTPTPMDPAGSPGTVATFRSPSGRWSSAIPLTFGQAAPTVGSLVDPDGEGIVVGPGEIRSSPGFAYASTLVAHRVSRGGVVTSTRLASDVPDGQWALSARPDAAAALAWVEREPGRETPDGRVRFAVRYPGSPFGPLQGTPGGVAGWAPSATLGPSGQLALTWTDVIGASRLHFALVDDPDFGRPAFEAAFANAQSIAGRRIAGVVTCAAEPCELAVSGSLRAAGRVIAWLRGAATGTGLRRSVEVRLSRTALRSVRRRLAAGRAVKARIAVRLAVPAARPQVFTVRLTG
jgi:hypothetical protein